LDDEERIMRNEDTGTRRDINSMSVGSMARKAWERVKMDAVGRWGSLERLTACASPETARKFVDASQKYLRAVDGENELELARRCGVMERGVQALEREALERGASCSDLTWFDLGVRVGDVKAVCVLRASDAEYVACTLAEELGEGVRVYTAADIVMMAHENQSMLSELKSRFSAYTVAVETTDGEAPW
jgi:hypothetical protein